MENPRSVTLPTRPRAQGPLPMVQPCVPRGEDVADPLPVPGTLQHTGLGQACQGSLTPASHGPALPAQKQSPGARRRGVRGEEERPTGMAAQEGGGLALVLSSREPHVGGTARG